MLFHYNDINILDVNSSIIYNRKNNLLLNVDLDMSYGEMKKKIVIVLGLYYNDMDIKITLRC